MISQSQRDYIKKMKEQKNYINSFSDRTKPDQEPQKAQDMSYKFKVDTLVYDKLNCVTGKNKSEKLQARLKFLDKIDKQYRKVFDDKKKDEIKKEFNLFPLLSSLQKQQVLPSPKGNVTDRNMMSNTLQT